MSLYRVKPVLKARDFSPEQGGEFYIAFDEDVDLHGMQRATLRLEFKQAKSEDEVKSILQILKEAGLELVMQKA